MRNRKPTSIPVQIYQIQDKKSPHPVLIATAIIPYNTTILSSKEDDMPILENIWNLCNIDCWWDDSEQYPRMYSNNGVAITFTSAFRGFCNEDIYVKSKWWYNGVFECLSYGWRQMHEDTAIYDIIHHCDTIH